MVGRPKRRQRRYEEQLAAKAEAERLAGTQTSAPLATSPLLPKPEAEIIRPAAADLAAFADKFNEAVGLSLDKALEILRLPLDPEDPSYLRILATQKETVASVLSSVARIDEGRLKGRSKDRMGEFLAMLKSQPAA